MDRSTYEETSPELVLVDRELALRARERLPEPADTLARLEREISLQRLVALQPDDFGDALEGTTSGRSRLDRREPSLRRRPGLLVAAATAAMLVIAALLLGVQVDLRGNPAGAESVIEARTNDSGSAEAPEPATEAVREPAPVTEPAPAPAPPKVEPSTRGTRYKPPGQDAARQPRPFAWAPVTGASAYRVEFFRGTDRIYSGATTRPQLELPRTWRFDGRIQRLRPGIYRWYVWPVRDGRRDTRATVQAELVID